MSGSEAAWQTPSRAGDPAAGPEGSGALAGRVALVTGASSGIGRATAVAFAREGARLALAGRRADLLASAVAECHDAGGPRSVPVPFDVSDEEACVAAVERVTVELGPVDVLVNGAGIADSWKFSDTETAGWRRIMTVNVEGPMWLCRAVLPGMAARRAGAIVNIGSAASRVGAPYISAYAASKHALLGLTRALAAEYGSRGVTVNCVCPGYVDTPMTERAVGNIMARTGRSREETLAALVTPQGRLVTVEEVAAVCVLLASDAGRGITGQGINVDGGMIQS